MTVRDAYAFDVTIPAGTPVAAPVTVDTSFPPRRVWAIHWRVPPGAAGLMGFRITSGGAQVFPVKPGTWLIRSGDAETLPVAGAHDSGKWDVTGYNTGVFPHTIHVVYHTEVITPEPPRLALLPNGLLSSWPRGDADLWPAGVWG